MDEILAINPWFLLFTVGSFLAPDTTQGPWYGGEAFGADGRIAIEAGSEATAVDALQRGPHLTQQRGVAVDVSECQIALRRVLNLVHLVGTLFDGDAIALLQYLRQFRYFSVKNLLYPAQIAGCCIHTFPSPQWVAYC